MLSVEPADDQDGFFYKIRMKNGATLSYHEEEIRALLDFPDVLEMLKDAGFSESFLKILQEVPAEAQDLFCKSLSVRRFAKTVSRAWARRSAVHWPHPAVRLFCRT